MRLELRVYKNRSRWIAELSRFPDKLKFEKFVTKKKAIAVANEWAGELKEQGRRFSISVQRATGAPEYDVGYDHDGSVVSKPDRVWYDTEFQLRFRNQYGDRALFLKTEDWSFAEKLIVDMKQQRNWDCEITQYGQEIRR